LSASSLLDGKLPTGLRSKPPDRPCPARDARLAVPRTTTEDRPQARWALRAGAAGRFRLYLVRLVHAYSVEGGRRTALVLTTNLAPPADSGRFVAARADRRVL